MHMNYQGLRRILLNMELPSGHLKWDFMYIQECMKGDILVLWYFNLCTSLILNRYQEFAKHQQWLIAQSDMPFLNAVFSKIQKEPSSASQYRDFFYVIIVQALSFALIIYHTFLKDLKWGCLGFLFHNILYLFLISHCSMVQAEIIIIAHIGGNCSTKKIQCGHNRSWKPS